MRLGEMLKKAVKAKKTDDIPGTVDSVLERECPLCKRPLRQYKPCCGAKNGYIGCRCGYKEIL